MAKRGGYHGGSTIVGPGSPLVSHRKPKRPKNKGPVDPNTPWPAEAMAEMHAKIDAALARGGRARGLGTPAHLKKKPR